jgi:hypothetical protein
MFIIVVVCRGHGHRHHLKVWHFDPRAMEALLDQASNRVRSCRSYLVDFPPPTDEAETMQMCINTHVWPRDFRFEDVLG